MTFRLGSIPVRVRGYFLLMAVMLGASFRSPPHIAIWVLVVFASILVHELGHALAGKAFGLTPHIELHGMGGTTSWIRGRVELAWWRSVIISLAGPFAGFAFGALVIVFARFGPPPKEPLVLFTIEQLRNVNIGWGVVNLLPMLPLDGGNVVRSVLDGITKGRGEKPARLLSIVIAGLALLFAVVTSQVWLGFLAALFTWSNVQAYRQAGQRALDAPLAAAIEKAYAALDRQDGAEAVALLRPVLAAPAAPELRQIGVRLFAYGLLLEGRWAELMPLLQREHAALGAEELARYAKAARELGRPEDAAQIDVLRTAVPVAVISAT
jgi:Zn-dependent protease